jgi:hypothetical protein
MKRLDVVQLAIIIVGLFIAFIFVSAVPTLLFSIITWFNSGLSGGSLMQAFLSTFIIYTFYFIAAAFCIKQSKALAAWICNKADFTADVNLAIDKKGLLYVLFIGMGIYGLVQHFPKLIVTAFVKIRSSNSFMPADPGDETSSSGILLQVMTVLLYFALVYYANVFADFFADKISNQEPEDEITENPTAE